MTQFAQLVQASHRVAALPGRRGKIQALAEFLKSLAPDEIDHAAHFLSGEIPQGRLGLGYAALKDAAMEPVADAPPLSIGDVNLSITELAAIRGAGSQARRSQALRGLFARATRDEQQFLLRLLMGELRQGALEGVMVDAIAQASGIPTATVRSAAMYSRNVAAVARAALLDGAAALEALQLQLFSPVLPMLAQTAADTDAALAQLPHPVAFEWKMDGARIQAHRRGAEVRLYTRNLNDVTASMPEIVEAVLSLAEPMLVLDGEVIAEDAAGRPHPFQITMRRFGRKQGVEAARAAQPLKVFFFDCLLSGAGSIAANPTTDRVKALDDAVPAAMRMPRLITASCADAAAFYQAALAAGHEGLMAKSLQAPYEAGNRGAGWLKIKRVHTLDLVVLAAEWGHGRRTGRLSNLHLGALDAQSGQFVMLGKTFKGLTDELLDWQTRELLAREIRRDAGTVYVRPELVVEIAFSDLQQSVRYPGGIALRLARVKRYRIDKDAAQADTMDAVRKLQLTP